MKTQFNTGRLYQSDGQRIVCKTVDGPDRHGIIFNDLSRGIDGFIPLLRLPTDRFALEQVTMNNYDHGNYTFDPIVCTDEYRKSSRHLKWEEK
jgi:hypothetical protein